MPIHQIQMRYDEVQDRVMLRLSNTNGDEFRFWLTRRFVQRLWGLLVQMLERDHAVQQQHDAQTRRTVMDIQHEGYTQQANYSKEFEEAPRSMPLGEEPVLLVKAGGKPHENGTQVLSLYPQEGKGIDMTLDTKLLHIFTRLLRSVAAKANWQLNLALHEGARQPATDPAGPPPKLN